VLARSSLLRKIKRPFSPFLPLLVVPFPRRMNATSAIGVVQAVGELPSTLLAPRRASRLAAIAPLLLLSLLPLMTRDRFATRQASKCVLRAGNDIPRDLGCQ
jgi:hypothetical protein